MKKSRIKNEFIKEVANVPIIQAVCEKLGISRQTYYRWCKEDPVFKVRAEEALIEGEALVNDFAESNVLQGIKKGDPVYTKFWLIHRNEKYKQFSKRPKIINTHHDNQATSDFLARFGKVAKRKEEYIQKMKAEMEESTSSQTALQIIP